MTLDRDFTPLSEVEDLRRSDDGKISGISVVQMIQALRGCVQELNQSSDHSIALIAQQTIVALDELYKELTAVFSDDEPHRLWPLIRTQYEIDREREIREFEQQQAREQQS